MLKVLELFAGIGACSKALERLGIEHEIVDAVEIDEHAIKSFNAIHRTNFNPQDIRVWDKNIEVDLIMHGSPCQDFSSAGKGAGGDEGSGTRSSMVYESLRIIKKLKPRYVIWENVKNLLSKKHKHIFEDYLSRMNEIGYTNYYQVLNAKDYGIPQNRERIFTISILGNEKYIFPGKEELKLRLKDMLEDEVDDSYYLSEEKINRISNWKNFQKSYSQKIIPIKNNTSKGYLEATEGDGIYINTSNKRGTVQKEMISTITGFQDKGVVVNEKIIKILGNYMPSGHEAGRVVDNEGIAPTVKENHGTAMATNIGLRIRKITPKECWRLMGFDDTDYENASKVIPKSYLYKQAGNSIVVNVLEKILDNLLGGNK